MKSNLIIAVLAIFTATTMTAYAAEEHSTEVKAEKSEKAPAKKKVKKHSHVEEKLGITPSEPVAGGDKSEPAKNPNRHDHLKEKH